MLYVARETDQLPNQLLAHPHSTGKGNVASNNVGTLLHLIFFYRTRMLVSVRKTKSKYLPHNRYVYYTCTKHMLYELRKRSCDKQVRCTQPSRRHLPSPDATKRSTTMHACLSNELPVGRWGRIPSSVLRPGVACAMSDESNNTTACFSSANERVRVLRKTTWYMNTCHIASYALNYGYSYYNAATRATCYSTIVVSASALRILRAFSSLHSDPM